MIFESYTNSHRNTTSGRLVAHLPGGWEIALAPDRPPYSDDHAEDIGRQASLVAELEKLSSAQKGGRQIIGANELKRSLVEDCGGAPKQGPVTDILSQDTGNVIPLFSQR
jgi:hypothetical protein